MAKELSVLGLMSGTSMDGIDAALLRTDGVGAGTRIATAFTPYPDDVRDTLRAALGITDPADPRAKAAERLVTDWHIRAVRDFRASHPHPVDLIGFHGQTISHDPANGHTLQLGDGQELATQTGIDVVFDFRTADVQAGGQGAPLLPLYHHARVRDAGLDMPVCVLNLGGVANITWMNGDDVHACDTGPANALIDDWMLKKTGVAIDRDGQTALKGRADTTRVERWLEHPFFNAPAPKSLDRNAFAACTVDDLSLEDGAATLAAFTVAGVLAALRHMPGDTRRIVVGGGGRHNHAVMRGLNAHIPAINADTLGWDGDSLEAEGFAFLAARVLAGLPLSLPTTTGVKTPMLGGRHVQA